MQVDSFSIEVVHGWFPYGFADVRLNDLSEALFPSQNRDKNGMLCASRLYAAQAVVLAVPTAIRCSLASSFAYMRPTFQVNPEVVDPPLASQSDCNVSSVDLDP